MCLLSVNETEVASYVEKFVELSSPDYAQQKQERRDACLEAERLSLDILVMSVALAVLSFLAAKSSSLIIRGLGRLAFLISVPVLYFSYNVHQVSHNMLEVLDCPFKFLRPVSHGFDIPKLRAQLTQGTFLFDTLTDLGLKAITQTETNRSSE